MSHGHVQVNGRRLDIPSARISPGDVVSLRGASLENVQVKDSLAHAEAVRPRWLDWDDAARRAKMTSVPDRASVLLEINTQLVVEFYPRSL